MTTKTYGVYGMLEWHALIPAGRMTLSLVFTDGKVSGYGVIPARYQTSDPVIQSAIEASGHFRNGKIRLLNTENMNRRPIENRSTAKTSNDISTRNSTR
ncbi:MAG: hypothetical protein NC097_04795 [Clostridium sp.]|nr:hypothetical protein [Prevotella sp.]MCM1429095.1 hypothetical protein [Clostridium sp.]MCM1475375.1 hypothetical protein [Muribaculaceae bacterium]